MLSAEAPEVVNITAMQATTELLKTDNHLPFVGDINVIAYSMVINSEIEI